MPQFPYREFEKLNRNGANGSVHEDEDFFDLDSDNGNVATEFDTGTKKPIQFRSVENKGPVKRVRISDDSKKSKSSNRQSPFKDLGLLEDSDSLVQFRNDFGVPVLLTLLAIGVVFAIYWFSQPESGESEDLDSIQQLIVQVETLDSEDAPSDAKRIEQLNSKIEFANQLLDFQEDTMAIEKGAEFKLQALSEIDSIHLVNGTSDPDNQSSLEATCRQFINSRKNIVSNHAKVGLTLIRARKYLDDPDTTLFPEFLDQFKLVSQFANDELLSAQTLMRVAQAFERKKLAAESAKLYRTISSSFSASHNGEIASIGTEARAKTAGTGNLLNELKALVGPDRKLEINQIQKLVGENTKEESVTTSGLESILDFVEYLVSKNLIPAAKEILDEFSKSIYFISAGIERESIKIRYDILQKQVELVGKRFDYKGLYSVLGRPITAGSLKGNPKMILFWSPDNQPSINLIRKISSRHKEFEKRRIQVVAISQIGEDESSKKRIEELSNETFGIDFLTLVRNDPESQRFIGRFPLPRLPFWVLINNRDKIQGYNISPSFVDLSQY